MSDQNIIQQVSDFITSLSGDKQQDVQAIHELILSVDSAVHLHFFDGLDANKRVVANPTIGYGHHQIHYANGTVRDFFRLGLSANKTGFSIYLMAVQDKTYLIEKYGKLLGKAKITGYCVRVNRLKDVDEKVLKELIIEGLS